MSFGEAVSYCFKHYADFNGRAQRSQYWFFVLLNFLISFGINMISGVTGVQAISYVGTLWSLATLVPSLAVAVRRLHDLNKSGWMLLIALIPCIGAIVLLIWFVQPGTSGPNQYGEDPLGAKGAPAPPA